MTQPIWFGVLFLIVLIIVGFIIAHHYSFKLWTIGVAVTLVSFALFYIPAQNYTWTEWGLDNLFAWSFVIVLYIINFIYSKFTLK